MELRYANRDIEKVCTDSRRMQKVLGVNVAKKLKLRIAELSYVADMADLLEGPGRWEELKADRVGQ